MFLLIALACKGSGDAGLDTGTARRSDADADGFTTDAGDCNDADPRVNPDIQESCNGVDDDCDGETDEGTLSLWYLDADGDTFGDKATEAVSCEQPANYIARAEDCDDGDAATFPGAPEVCDGADQDCDDMPDNGVKLTFYADQDGDGYGAAGATAWQACTQPTGSADNDFDCDDKDPGTNPSVSDACDGHDDDCDGVTDEDPDRVWYLDADGDGLGDASTATLACEAPTDHVADASGFDCDDENPSVGIGAEICDGLDNDCDGVVDNDPVDARGWFVDGDGDGYGATPVTGCEQPAGTSTLGADCDDANAEANPAGEELCDAADNDCDGTVDEDDASDASTWYEDADGDGYGDPASTHVSCLAPLGYVANASDCDDGDAANSPVGTELCDGEDNDCDGDTDEDSAADASTWYLDHDKDGYGRAAQKQVSCEAPSGYVADATDCDDRNAKENPAATEVCDGDDDDCDGTTDEADAKDASTWYDDADGDGYGDPGASAKACDAPSGAVSDASDCDDADATVNPGEQELCNLVDDDCDGTTDEADAKDASTWYKDADSDGYGDPARTSKACTAPSGSTSTGTDCDDGDTTIKPGATELCDGADNDCDGDTDEASAIDVSTFYLDYDGDGYGRPTTTVTACDAPSGYVSNSSDCHDSAASIKPGGTETCDGADNDCNGATDDSAVDAQTQYADADGDAYGDASSSTTSCEATKGYVTDKTDCDDADPSANPGGTEVCDAVDNDCDGTADDSASDASTWYYDKDNDGWGTSSTTKDACSQPTNYVDQSGDCNDNLSTVNPDEAEICAGTRDDDCDSLIDDSDPDVSDPKTWYADVDGDGYGDPSSTSTACDQPSSTSTDATDCDDGDASVNPAASEVCDNGLDDDCDGTAEGCGFSSSTTALTVTDATLTITGVTEGGSFGYFGDDSIFLDDIDGDGLPEIAIAANVNGAYYRGMVYVFYSKSGDTGSIYASAYDGRWVYDTAYQYLGHHMAAGDFDGDGLDELIIAADNALSGSSYGGAVYVTNPPTSSGTISASFMTYGAASDYIGKGLEVVGDLDGDGDDELVIGAPSAEYSKTDSGEVYIVKGGQTGNKAITSALYASYYSDGATYDYFGNSVSSAGDIDGDGVNDVMMAARSANTIIEDGGSVYIVTSPTATTGTKISAAADVTINGQAMSGGIGYQVTPLGDADGDGYDDIAFGSQYYGAPAGYGQVWVFLGPLSGTYKETQADWSAGSDSSSSGSSFAEDIRGGDLDGDGLGDLIVGSSTCYSGSTPTGCAYIFLAPVSGTTGASSADAQIVGSSSSEYFGTAIDIADWNGDGANDLLIGSYNYSSTGRASVFLGGAN